MMRLFVVFFFVVVCAAPGVCQDTTSQEKKGIISTVTKKMSDFRSKLSAPIDSARDSASFHLARKMRVGSVVDTLQTATLLAEDSINDLATSLEDKTDLQRKMRQVEETANKPVNTLNSKTVAVDNAIQEKIEGGEKKVSESVNEGKDKVNAGVSKATDGELKIPAQDIGITADKLGVSAPPELASKTLSDNSLSVVVQEEIPALDKFDVTDKLNVSGIAEKTNIDLPHQKEFQDIAGNIGKLDASLAEAEQYESELNKIKEKDLASAEKLAEQKVKDLEPVKEFAAQTQKVTAQQAEYEAMIRRYKDKKALQQEIIRKAQHVANEELNQYSPAFKNSQEQLARVKKLNSNVKSYKEIKKKRPNQMKGKPFREHLVPGMNIQVFNTRILNIDWGAQLGYKVTSRFWMGAGGFFRSSFSEEHSTWIKAEHIYGFRSYLNFGLYKSFYAHGEFTSLHGKYHLRNQAMEGKFHQSFSGYVGLGKRYDISKKIKGSILVLYRGEIMGDLPAMSKINMRIEFNYNIKSKSRRQLLQHMK